MSANGTLAIVLLSLALGVASSSCTAEPQHAGHGGPPDTAFAAMQARGAMVMGVDQFTSPHVFEDLPDGGRIVLDRDTDADTAGIARIRRHMRDIAAAFARGDFTRPFQVHATQVPGTLVMTARRSQITYEAVDRPRGAEVRIHTTDSSAVAAVHTFLAFQRGAHHAAAQEALSPRSP